MAEAAFDTLTFPLSYARQVRMHRRGVGKSHGGFFKRIWGIAAIYMLIVWLPTLFFSEQVLAFYERLARSFDVSCSTVSGVIALLILATFLLGLFAVVRRMRASQSLRVGHSVDWTITAEDDGLLYASRNVEYLLRWPGFHQVFTEREGLILVHGNSYFFVPNEAFRNAQEHQAFVRMLAARIPAEARARSAAALTI